MKKIDFFMLIEVKADAVSMPASSYGPEVQEIRIRCREKRSVSES